MPHVQVVDIRSGKLSEPRRVKSIEVVGEPGDYRRYKVHTMKGVVTNYDWDRLVICDMKNYNHWCDILKVWWHKKKMAEGYFDGFMCDDKSI